MAVASANFLERPSPFHFQINAFSEGGSNLSIVAVRVTGFARKRLQHVFFFKHILKDVMGINSLGTTDEQNK